MRAAGTTYLPRERREPLQDYNDRLNKTVLFEGYPKTRDSLVGLVFNGEITLKEDVPEQIRKLWEDIDLAGNHGDVFCKSRFTDQFEGASVILVDMEQPDNQPRVTRAGDTKADVDARRPYWVGYKHHQVTNWRQARLNGKQEFTLITFKEVSQEAEGDYGEKEVTRYRTFRKVDGRVVWELDRENPEATTEEGKLERENSGTIALTRIPIAVGGELGSPPTLLGLAYLNISHWQNSSDQENILHITRVPKLVRIGQELVNQGAKQEEIEISVTSVLDAPVGGDYKWLEVQKEGGMGLGRQHLLDIEQRMGMMGLSTLTQRSDANITAFEKAQDAKEKHSVLSTMARSAQDQIELALELTAEYLRLPDGGSIELPASQDDMVLDAQDLQLAQQAVKEGTLRIETFHLLAGKRWKIDLSEEAAELKKLQEAEAAKAAAEKPDPLSEGDEETETDEELVQ